ncbi:hypothetical protein [Paenibacillus cymbidii]|nr:hypothetical protein [Paenibacillus cymbidii]
MNIRSCTDGDLPLLAALNKQLIEDERHDNPIAALFHWSRQQK